MTDVKICGLTRESDVELACSLGAAYVGFNFSPLSPRRVTAELAGRLARAAGAGVGKVGVFVEESLDQIASAVGAAKLDLVQLHRPLLAGDLDLPVPVVAVARVRDGSPDLPDVNLLSVCSLLLLDSELPDRPGGTGRPLAWAALSNRTWPVPLMLAGGLTPENVEEAIERIRPAAVDVASGVESSPGVKDAGRMKQFFEAVHRADALAPSPPGRARG